MTFQTFEITELAEDSENDYAVEIQASSCMLGVLITEDELHAMGKDMVETAAQDEFKPSGLRTVADVVGDPD